MYCLMSKGFFFNNHENYSNRFPEGFQKKRKFNNDDKHDHGQEKRRPLTLWDGHSTRFHSLSRYYYMFIYIYILLFSFCSFSLTLSLSFSPSLPHSLYISFFCCRHIDAYVYIYIRLLYPQKDIDLFYSGVAKWSFQHISPVFAFSYLHIVQTFGPSSFYSQGKM